MRLMTSLLVLPLIMTSLSSSAFARQNHCDHSSGKTIGAIGGAVLGGVLGGVLDHGRAGGIALGAGGGALAGGLAGDADDDRRDREECGVDAESYQRKLDREDARDQREYARQDQREREIEYDRAVSRGRRYPRPMPPRYPRPMRYQCQDLGRGFGVVDLAFNRVVEVWYGDLYGCQDSARYMNRYR